MDEIINETTEIAYTYFKGFGFEDEQIVSLLKSGKRDLTKELTKLKELLENEHIEIDTVNLSLHALKGLFLTMGNDTMGNKLNELRKDNENECTITEVKRLFNMI